MLSRGITLCERSRLIDLKYSMQHLLAHVTFKSNPRAALKAIDHLLPDVEAYQHTAWVYAFRFLRASLALAIPHQPDVTGALQHLRSVSTSAEAQRHYPVLIMSCVLEALVHARSGTAESLEQAQRALTTARTHQLDPSLTNIPPLMALVNIVDMACELACCNFDAIGPKMLVMQRLMDQNNNDESWSPDGSFCVPIGISGPAEIKDDAKGILQQDTSGRWSLVFNWLKRQDLYSIGYLLSGVASMQRNCMDEKAGKYLREGLKLTDSKHTRQDVWL